ncbi:hypothetical protein PPTG_22074 [Phytophthora nicotianae INRA-310]|uniref:Uncharacterized protein n=1 Tax=Phytophthora nicotianae (strain INRA-310) TaxID=761204 RepID=W2QPQ3_PHYN3|nr:hypothetical protein PPTG_22074 [Phytophthora nicotianae INRA-310]ETN15093.1 hypothetical protein PPTG_22074 [Phytophthora nicotianae INRA-310]
MLYSVTNGQEVAATMAALYVLRETAFWFSHEFVPVNLRNILRKTVESVEITLSQQQMQRIQGAVSTENALERYWKRNTSVENISFMEICENYEYSEIPDITSDLDNDQSDFYYTAVLTLFKPHRKNTLLTENLSLLGNYKAFIESGDQRLVRMLLKYEAQWQDFHHSKRNNDVEEESLEEELLRTRAPPSSSWIPSGNQASTNDDIGIETATDIPYEFLDVTDIATPHSSTTKLCEDAVKTVGAAKNLAAAIATASTMYSTTPHILLPAGFTTDNYASQIIKKI